MKLGIKKVFLFFYLSISQLGSVTFAQSVKVPVKPLIYLNYETNHSETASERSGRPYMHSHNDYNNKQPLYSALDLEFKSIEADIHLVDGDLFVAHDPDEIEPRRTLEKLYLIPLSEIYLKNRGFILPDREPLILFIDIKTDPVGTYLTLRDKLEKFKDMLTHFEGDKIRENPVTILISGNRPVEFMKCENTRIAALDGRISDLDSNYSVSLMPIVSASASEFGFTGNEVNITDERLALVQAFVRVSHSQNKKTRLWGIPDDPFLWQLQMNAGLDFIGTDDPYGLYTFINQRN